MIIALSFINNKLIQSCFTHVKFSQFGFKQDNNYIQFVNTKIINTIINFGRSIVHAIVNNLCWRCIPVVMYDVPPSYEQATDKKHNKATPKKT